jgi:hypothetical protein
LFLPREERSLVPSVHSVFLSVYGAVDGRSLPPSPPMFPRLCPERNGPNPQRTGQRTRKGTLTHQEWTPAQER